MKLYKVFFENNSEHHIVYLHSTSVRNVQEALTKAAISWLEIGEASDSGDDLNAVHILDVSEDAKCRKL